MIRRATRIRAIVYPAAALCVALAASTAGAITIQPRLSIYEDEKGGRLRGPDGVACGEGPLLVVADTGNDRLLRYEYDRGSLKGGSELKVAELESPSRLGLTTKGEILALDARHHRIVRLSADGKFSGFVEPEGLAQAASLRPRSFDVDAKDNLVVLDVSAGNVVAMDPTHKVLREIELPRVEAVFTDVTAASDGTIYVLDTLNAIVYSAPAQTDAFSPLTKSMKDRMSFPTRVTTDDRGILYLVDEHGGSIVMLGMDGSPQGSGLGFGWAEGMVRYPSQLCVNRRGEGFVADRANNRIQIVEVVR